MSEHNAAEGVRQSVGASDPYEREQQTFPVLNDDQVGRLKRYGACENVPEGTVLFKRGDRGVDFFFILEGAIEIFDLAEDGSPVSIHVHARHQFTGELDLFNQRKILVGGRTTQDSRLVRLTRDEFNRMSSTEQDIGEIIMRAFILRRTAFIVHKEAGVTIIGPSADRDVVRMSRFLTRNGYPCNVLSPDSGGDAERYAREHDIDLGKAPAVRTPDGCTFYNPPTTELADKLGLTEQIDEDHVFDLAVVGAGPSGLSACVYAASENVDTIVIEAEAPGGQAGTSSKIENYLGFPTGISGQALAGRAWIQGQKFGARFAIARAATGIRHKDNLFEIVTEGDCSIRARSVVLACGATYRRLNLPDYDKYEGQGIHYAATALEAQFCKGSEVAVIGGGNSAGQAAVFLSGFAKHVHVLVRSEGLAASMSDYLVRRIDESTRITLHPYTELTALHGKRTLDQVTWKNSQTGDEETRDVTNIFVMIGAVPNTSWMGDCVDLDEKGFIVTGANASEKNTNSPFATSVEGIFAVGDVRSSSVKRVASGVGEGSVCVTSVHEWLSRES